uniref:Exportin-7/Ran-binding protein 17 TPR repeats domain-containing protein n=1 Tax=Tetranychus urticae TaxID=32264 RepID=T1JVK3_TETUR
MGQCPPNSIHYLLNLWQRMVASVYITSRLDVVAQIVNEGLDSPFEDVGMIQQQLEQLSTIARCEYEKTCALIVQLFDQTAQTNHANPLSIGY